MSKHSAVLTLASSALFFSFAKVAVAAGGAALPWEGPLVQIQASLTGPVALAVATVAIVVAGAMLVWGGEINDFARRMIYVVLVIGVITGGASLLTTLFGGAGATIGTPPSPAIAEAAVPSDEGLPKSR